MQPVSAFKAFENSYRPVQTKNEMSIHQQNSKKESKDPLSKYPLRLCAYANEIGAALSPVNAALSTALWVPALMYFGADIYDKYKNDNTEYNPSKKRGFEQAVFQTLSSVFLPTAAVRIGQKIASKFVKESKSGLPSEVRKEVIEFTLNSIKENRLMQNTRESLKEKLALNFETKLENIKPMLPNKKFLSKLSSLLFENHDPVHSVYADREKVLKYLNKKVDEIYDIREGLINGTPNARIDNKLRKYFDKEGKKLKNIYPENYADKAAKQAVNKVLKKQNFRINIPATIGGFIALAIAAVPIDLFVEKVIIKKMVQPGVRFVSDRTPKKDKK